MAGEIIRPADLTTERTNPVPSEFMVVDNGVTVAKSKISDVVLSGRPTASQAEAEAGTDPIKAMTPLTSRQAINERLTNSSILSTVARTGSYTDLTGAPPALTDGDKGDIEVSGAGSVWTVTNVDAENAQFTFEYAPSETVTRSVAQVIREAPYNLRTLFPVSGDGTADDTAGINAAFAKCLEDNRSLYIPAGLYRVSQSGAEPVTGNKYCLVNRGVSIIGEGAKDVTIAPFAPLAADVDYMHILPGTVAGKATDDIKISGFRIWAGYPNFDTGVTGKRGIWALFNVAGTNAGHWEFSDLSIPPTLDLSLHLENNPTLLPQGCPSNSLIDNNSFWGGINLGNVGDSNVITRNVIRSPLSSKVGIFLDVVDNGFGSAGHNVIEDNNIDAHGGAIIVHSGRHVNINRNNIEHTAGPGTALGAVVDILGDFGPVHMCELTNNHIAAFGTSSASRLVAITNATRTFVHRNEFLTGGTMPQAIWNRTGSVGALFGDNSFGAGFTNKFLDDGGTGTRSISTAAGYTPA